MCNDNLDKAMIHKNTFNARFPRLAQIEFRFIKHGSLMFVPTDKDGSFVWTAVEFLRLNNNESLIHERM